MFTVQTNNQTDEHRQTPSRTLVHIHEIDKPKVQTRIRSRLRQTTSRALVLRNRRTQSRAMLFIQEIDKAYSKSSTNAQKRQLEHWSSLFIPEIYKPQVEH